MAPQQQLIVFYLIVAGILLFVAGQWMFRLPLVIYRTQRFNSSPTLQRFDLDESPPPGKAGKYFRSMDKQFAAIGFERLDCMALPDALPNVRALMVMYQNRRTKDLALATMMYGIDLRTDEVNLCSSYVEIVARYKDDEIKVIQTNNVQLLGSFPPSAGEITYRFPQITKVEDLFDLHCKLIERDGPQGKKYVRLDTDFRGDCLAYLQAVLVESYDKQIGTGYLTRDPDSDDYRPTLKGAFLMSWAQQTPLKEYLWNQVTIKARRLARELQS